MKKLKILLLALAATISVGAWADTTILSNENGWEKITAMPEDPSKYFFALVDNNADLMMGLAQGNHQESGFKTMYYQTSANPTTDLTKLWFIEAMSDVSGYESCYTFRNVSYNIWALQTENNNPWNFRTHNQFSPIEWTATIPKYDNENKYWTIQNGRYPNDGYLGAWENVEKGNGVECALNVPINNSRIGHFQIYSILKSDFIKLYANGEKNKNITFMLLNPSFENGHTYGWTQKGTMSLGPQGNDAFGKDGNTYAENYQPNGNIDMYQEIQNLPMGTYKISFKARARGVSSASLYANSVKTALKIIDEDNTYEASIVLDNNSTLKVGIEAVGTGVGQSWVACDNFQLTLVEAGLPDVTKAEGKMNKDVSEAQDAAISKYNENKTLDNYNVAFAAIEAAKASIAVYASIKKWYDDAQENLTEKGYNHFLEETASIKTAYDNGTITDGVEENATLQIKYNEHINKYYKPGADITDVYIKNAKLLNGKDDWNCDPNEYSDYLAKENNGRIGVLEFYAGWGSRDLKQYSMTQKIKLPAGEYKLSSNAFYRYGQAYNTNSSISEAYMVCGTNRTIIPTLGSIQGLSSYANSRSEAIKVFEQGLYETSRTFKLLEDNTEIEIGYTGTHSIEKSWFISGPLKLVYVGPVSVEGYIEDLKTALVSVPEDKMEKQFKEALDLAVEAANKILVDYEADPTSVSAKDANDACEVLRAAIIAAEQSIAVYKQIALINTKAESLDADGQEAYSETLEKYNNGELSTVEEAQKAYIAAVKAQTTIDSDWSALGGTDRSAWVGATGNYATNYVEKYAGDDDAFEEGNVLTQTIEGLMPYAKYEVKFTAVANVARNLSAEYYGEEIAQVFANETVEDITVVNQSSCVPANTEYQRTLEGYADEEGKLTFGLKNIKAGGQWYIAQFTSLKLKALPTANITVKENVNWGTFCAPFDVAIPEGVKAYTAEEDGNTVAFTEVETTIPAGTPVVVYSATEVNEEFNGKATATESTYGALVGVYAATSGITAETGHTNYVLQNNAQGVGFYKVAEGSTISLNANRCYMTLATSAGAKDCVVLDGIVTGINEILNPTDKSAEGIFDLNGRKLAAPQKGINIINGVKVIVK